MKLLIAGWIITCSAVAVASIASGIYAAGARNYLASEMTAKVFTWAVAGLLMGTVALLCWR